MEPGYYYHIYTHANGSENLFRSDENFRYFLQKYGHHVPSAADTLAYCLMPNHVHFLVRFKNEPWIKQASNTKTSGVSGQNQTSEVLETSEVFGHPGVLTEKQISQPFSNLLNAYAKAYNKMYSRMGSLFIHKFKRNQIRSDTQLTNAIRYIHRNPVHHGFAADVSKWPWSSYNIIIGNEETWIKRDEVIRWFGNAQEFVKLHQMPLNKDEIKEIPTD